MTDKMREQMRDAYEDLTGEPWDDAGLYKQVWSEAWERSWEASREAVEIELPEVKDLEIVGVGCTYEDSFVDYLQVVRAIETEGLKVKPC